MKILNPKPNYLQTGRFSENYEISTTVYVHGDGFRFRHCTFRLPHISKRSMELRPVPRKCFSGQQWHNIHLIHYKLGSIGLPFDNFRPTFVVK